MKPYNRYFEIAISTGCLLTIGDVAHAYVGPGAGLGVIGTLIAFVGTVFLAIVGFVWYPIKRLLRKRRRDRVEDVPADQPASAAAENDDTESYPQ